MNPRPPGHRFYRPGALRAGSIVALSAQQAGQIARVLRMRAGDQTFTLFDGAGAEGAAELVTVTPRHATTMLLAVNAVPWPFPWLPVLYLPLLRPQRFEWALEKAAELGAAEIVPLVTARTVHGDEQTGDGKRERWQRILLEASEQCGSAFVPALGAPLRLTAALDEPADVRLFAWEDSSDRRRLAVEDALRPPPNSERLPRVALFVGPEGGFTADEAALARAGGCQMVSLGPLVLRTETAAIALLAVLAQAAIRHGRADLDVGGRQA